MTDYEHARRKWIEENGHYAAFGKVVEERLAEGVKALGIWCQTSSRPKELHSLIKKLIKKPGHTYESLPDKVGVRCVVRYLHEADSVLTLAQDLFDCSGVDKKVEALGPALLGYLSIHTQVTLRSDHADSAKFAGLQAELQIKTLGQLLWSEMSHDSVYKNDDELVKLPVHFQRRVNLMAGLIEVADEEFNRLDGELPRDDAHTIYKALERFYFRLTAKRPDAELSITVIRLVRPLYSDGVPGILKTLETFFNARLGVLQHIYATAPSSEVSALLYQPELLMLYERLEVDQLATREAWRKEFPEKELERVANMLGISFD